MTTASADEPTIVEQVASAIGERLREERARLGYSQAAFSEAVGVSKTTQFNYESGGRSPDALYLHAAKRLGVDIDYVISGQRSESTEDSFVTVPFFQVRVSAGGGAVNEPSEAYKSIGMSISLDWLRRRRLNAANLAVVRVRGHSMSGVLSDGDPVLVDTSDTSPRSGFVYVLRQGDELLVKYCQLMPGGVLRVMSANTNFPAYDVDLSKTDDVQIVGRVVASMHEW